MENVEIASVLGEVADLLELQDANPFRIRAYRNAVRTILGLTRPLSEMVAEEFDLKQLPGIGDDLSTYIVELVRTGRLRLLDQLRREVPGAPAELMKLEGIGPKRAMQLHRELGIRSVAELEREIGRGEVERLSGFGAKTVERLRRSIADYRKHEVRYKLSDADQLVRPLLEYMRRAPGIERLEVAGSYRRRRETVGDIDLLVACERPKRAMTHFTAYPDAERVEAAGTTRGAITLRSGLRVDLRIVPLHSYGAALHYFTGSKAHNIAVRRLGIEKGLRINEYGIFRIGKGKKASERRIGGEREEDVFAAVGMDPVPPELREDRGEVEAALAHRLPRLVTVDDLRGDLQLHTTWSDGRDSIEAMARACKQRGYKYLAVTDHSRAVTVAGGLGARDLERQWKEIARVARKVPGITILKGMEVDILKDGTLDLPDELLYRLDVVVAAVHGGRSMTRARMTERVIRALRHPAVHILAHPTGRLINRREPYEIDVEAVLEAAAELGVAVELNAQPDRLDLNDVHASRARELGVKIVINTDAHTTDQLGFITHGVEQARRAWLEKKHVLNTMSLAELKKWLGRRRK